MRIILLFSAFWIVCLNVLSCIEATLGESSVRNVVVINVNISTAIVRAMCISSYSYVFFLFLLHGTYVCEELVWISHCWQSKRSLPVWSSLFLCLPRACTTTKIKRRKKKIDRCMHGGLMVMMTMEVPPFQRPKPALQHYLFGTPCCVPVE